MPWSAYTVKVAAPNRHDALAPPQKPLPQRKRLVVTQKPWGLPHLHAVRAKLIELPRRPILLRMVDARQRALRVRGIYDRLYIAFVPAAKINPLCKPPDIQVASVRGDLLSGEPDEARAIPFRQVRVQDVVLGQSAKLQPAPQMLVRHGLYRVVAVAVECMGMKIALVPTLSPLRNSRVIMSAEDSGLRTARCALLG